MIFSYVGLLKVYLDHAQSLVSKKYPKVVQNAGVVVEYTHAPKMHYFN